MCLTSNTVNVIVKDRLPDGCGIVETFLTKPRSPIKKGNLLYLYCEVQERYIAHIILDYHETEWALVEYYWGS